MKHALAVALTLVATGLVVSCASLSGLNSGTGADGGTHDGATVSSTSASSTRSASDAIAPDAGASCVIVGTKVGSEAPDPINACESCQPEVTTSAWSPVNDGKSCGTDGICHMGSCVSGCEVGGVYYVAGAAMPNDPCQTCQIGVSTAAFSPLASGTSCGNGQVCTGGQCGTQCDVAGVVYASGAANPSNPCQSCQPGTTQTAWSSVSDGTGCGIGKVCASTSCVAECFIGGTLYTSAQANPNKACEVCDPAQSTSAWSNAADGTPCASGEVCQAGACAAGCFIGDPGAVYAPGALEPANGCVSCQPATNTTQWTPIAGDGTFCPAGQICQSGSCVGTCVVGGITYPSGATNPANACQSCQPATSSTSFVDLPFGASCGSGCTCNGNGGATIVYSYTGSVQNFVIPAGVTSVNISAAGAAGQSTQAGGGVGEVVSATFSVTAGQSLAIYVGGTHGWNGGGSSGGGGAGGDASDVREGGTSLLDRIIVAAGGGGAGGGGALDGAGGAGGFATGATGGNANFGSGGLGGVGATTSAGGAGGAGAPPATAGASGSLSVGGAGGTGNSAGGGGGGGYYGGGGGGGGCGGNTYCSGGGGGGGSSYVTAGATGVMMAAGAANGGGQVTIAY